MAFFADLEQQQKILKICMEIQKTANSQSNLDKEKQTDLAQSGFLTSNYTIKLQ